MTRSFIPVSCINKLACELVTSFIVRASTQHMRIVFTLFIALAFASVKMPPKKKGRVHFRHRNHEWKRNRRASLTKNGPQNWQKATKAHFISREVARGVGYPEKRKCCSCWECKPLQNPAWRAKRRKPMKLMNYGHFAPWSFRPQSLHPNQKSFRPIIEVTSPHTEVTSDRIPFSSLLFSSSSPLPLSNIYSPSTCQIDTILKAYIHFNSYMKRICVEESHRTKWYLVYFERLQRTRIHVQESNRTKWYLVLPNVFKRTRLEAALVNIWNAMVLKK